MDAKAVQRIVNSYKGLIEALMEAQGFPAPAVSIEIAGESKPASGRVDVTIEGVTRALEWGMAADKAAIEGEFSVRVFNPYSPKRGILYRKF